MVIQVFYDVVVIGLEVNDDSGIIEGKNLDGDSRFGFGNVVCLLDLVD